MRRFVNGGYVRDGRIGLAVTADMLMGGRIRQSGGKAEFDCVLNQHVLRALGRPT